MGRGLLARSQPAGAVQVFRLNQAARPGGFEANADLGEALAAEGKPADAVPFLEKALAIRDDPGVRALLNTVKR